VTVRRLLWLLPGLFLFVLGLYLVLQPGPSNLGWLQYATPLPNTHSEITGSVAILTRSQVTGWALLGLGLVACGTWGGYVAGERAAQARRPVRRPTRRPVKRTPVAARRR